MSLAEEITRAGNKVDATLGTRAGMQVDWRATTYTETQLAIASCPFRNEFGRETLEQSHNRIRRFDPMKVVNDLARSYGRSLAKDAAATKYPMEPFHRDDVALHITNPDQDARGWLADLAKSVDVNSGEKKPWFGVLRDFVYRYPPEAKVKNLDSRVVHRCLQELKGGK